MLGNKLLDPLFVESTLVEIDGLGYLDMQTELQSEKQLVLQTGYLWDRLTVISGYEIHCGITTGAALQRPAVYFKQNQRLVADGAISDDNQILGTYLHGLFDSADACQAIMDWVGVHIDKTVDLDTLRESQLNRLAKEVEASLNPSFLAGFYP